MHDDYVDEGGKQCPSCKSRKIKRGRKVRDGEFATKLVRCLACGETWEDVLVQVQRTAHKLIGWRW
jgi:uncharacterized Zn finger protein